MIREKIGTKENIVNLFSHPNNCSNVCYLPWTLEQTVKHYISQSIQRDGYNTTSLTITVSGNDVFLESDGETFSGEYLKNLIKFLEIGLLGFDLSIKRNNVKKWKANWRFLLPLGISIFNHKTIEMMDFPPVSLVLEKQDYLNSKTSDRWSELLLLNGADKIDLEKFESILDIVPIAAPAGDGAILDQEGVYNGDFDGYTLSLLDFFSKTSDPLIGKPLVAFGAPIRQWLKRKYGLSLNVLTVGTFKLDNNRTISTIGSNHPAFIFYAGHKFICEPDKDKLNFELAFKVMQQDLIVAQWQVEMGSKPASDPKAVLAKCKTNWANRPSEIEDLVNRQVYGKTITRELQEYARSLATETDFKFNEKFLQEIEKNAPLELLKRDW
ncbi:hypothetical protein [Chryseolinea soli]|uniref:Uncharacterized protein n=1 Tax=Chryseolinea soli TaxID=2321403 RepID=A0A385SR17_9BACT|nr:hypothetical protein [Chryseolinea soli]AYB31980.1 hypothetical protein D4L85_16035 [Chryseolinea soli]